MNPSTTDSPTSSDNVPIDDLKVAHFTEHTGPRIPPNFRAILRELGRYADPVTGVAGPSQLLIADALDMHRTTVSNGLKELEYLGFLTSKAKPGTGGKQLQWAFTAADTGWHPEPKGEVEKGPLLRAYRRLVEEFRKRRDDDEKTIAELEARVAQLEGSSQTSSDSAEERMPDETHGGNGQDAAVPGFAAGRPEQDEVNVGATTDIDPPDKWSSPAAASKHPAPQSHYPRDGDDNRKKERGSDQAQRQRYEPLPDDLSSRQAGSPRFTEVIEQLAFPSEATAPSSWEGFRVPDSPLGLSSGGPGLGPGVAPDAPLAPLPIPTGLVAEPAIDGSLTLSWYVEGDDRVAGYQVVRKCRSGAGTGKVLREVEGRLETGFIDWDVVPGAEYIYMVRTKGDVELGEWSRHLTVSLAR